ESARNLAEKAIEASFYRERLGAVAKQIVEAQEETAQERAEWERERRRLLNSLGAASSSAPSVAPIRILPPAVEGPRASGPMPIRILPPAAERLRLTVKQEDAGQETGPVAENLRTPVKGGPAHGRRPSQTPSWLED
ncbi:unnamed protein product, partial [Amoebophrya sp. A25]